MRGLLLLVAGLAVTLTSAWATPAKTQHLGLKGADIAGYYVAESPHSPFFTLHLTIINGSIRKGDTSGCEFNGQGDGNDLVGQVVRSGDEGILDNYLTLDILSQNLQDYPTILRGWTIMSAGHIIGLELESMGVEVEGQTITSGNEKPMRYRRVTVAEWRKAIQRLHRARALSAPVRLKAR